MADIKLERPEAGEKLSIPAEEGARFIFDLPPREYTVAKDGDNLDVNFNDGSQIKLENFYATYNSESLPSFNLDGEDITAEEFFTAMNEPDLMPAAGPAGTTAAANNRYHQYDNMELASGIDHLTRLDYNSDRSFEWDDSSWITSPDYDAGWDGENGENGENALVAPIPVNHPVTIVPEHPLTPGSGIPNLPGNPNDPDEPGDPSNPGNLDPGLPRSLVRVLEKNLGTADASQEESFIINAPDGVGTISIGNQIVWENGQLVAQASRTFATDEGKMTITGFNPDTGRLTYTYELTNPTTEHEQKGIDSIAHNFKVTVTDTDGDTASSYITVVVVDDVPEANPDFDYVVEDGKVEATGNVIAGSYIMDDVADPSLGRDRIGADELDRVEWAENTKGDYVLDKDGTVTLDNITVGTLTLDDQGNYTFVLDDKYNVPDGGMPDLAIDYKAFDRDGDEASSTLTIKIRGNDHTPREPGGPGTHDPLELFVPDRTITVDESEMEGGTRLEGLNNHGTSDSQSVGVLLTGDGFITFGDIVFEIKDGSARQAEGNESFHINGVTISNIKLTEIVDSAEGEANWQITYDYELTDNVHHNNPNSAGAADNLSASVPIKVKNTDGGQSVGSLVINVHDDRPEISAEGFGVGSDTELSRNDVVTGELLYRFGADQPEAESITVTFDGKQYVVELGENAESTTIDGKYGSLTIHGSGNYEYAAKGKIENGRDEFELKITDSDDDSATTKLNFGVKGDSDVPITVTVTTPGDSDITGDTPGSNNPLVDGSKDLSGETTTPSHDIVIADVAGATHQNAHVAFLVDLSSSLNADNLTNMKASLKETIQDLFDHKDTASIDVLIVGFNIVARNYDSFKLSTQEDVTNIGRVIDAMGIGGYYSGTDPYNNSINKSAQDAVGTTMLGATNYEHAFNLAEHWFTSNHYDKDSNSTFLITDGKPTAYINDKAVTAVTGTVTPETHFYIQWHKDNPATLDPSDDIEEYLVSNNVYYGKTQDGYSWTWKSGTDAYFTTDQVGFNCYVNKAGYLYHDRETNAKGEYIYKNPVIILNKDTGEYQQGILIKGTDNKYHPSWQARTLYRADGTGLYKIADIKLTGTFIKADWSDWEPGGEPKYFEAAQVGLNVWVNSVGVLFRDQACKQPIYIFDAGNESKLYGNLNGYSLLVLQQGEDGKYHPYMVNGSFKTDTWLESSASQADGAFEALDGISTVIAIGVSGNDKDIADGTLNNYDSNGTAITIDNFTDIKDTVLDKWQELSAGNDTVDGGEGRDILFGDRVSDVLGENAPEANIQALKDKLELHQNVTADVFLAALANNAAEVAAWLDNTVDPENEKGASDTLIGGKDSDVLFGMGGNDILIGDTTTLADLEQIIGKNGDGLSKDFNSISDKLEHLDQFLEISQELENFDKANSNDRDGDDQLFGGHGKDILYGDGGDDRLDGGTGDDTLIGGAGDDTLIGGTGNDTLIGGAGDDILLGGDNDDLLFGGSGNDYLDGGAGHDALLGGDGNDLIIFDPEDILIDGGTGLDIILAGKTDLTLGEMLQNYLNHTSDGFDPGKPMVNDVEVMIKGLDTSDITSMGDLNSYGISLGKSEDGADRLLLDKSKGWEKVTDDNTFTNNDGLTIETNGVLDVSSETGNVEMITLQVTMQTDTGSC